MREIVCTVVLGVQVVVIYFVVVLLWAYFTS
jgi:hypothetical protein